MISNENNDNIRKALYPLLVLCILIFFCKMIRHPKKNYSLLLILILIGPLFVSAILEIITLFGPGNALASSLYNLLNKFVSLWIICLALCHYITLKAVKGKYRQFPFKIFTVCAVSACIAITGISTHQFFVESNRDYLFIDLLAIFSLGYIAFSMSRFREEIKYGPYSVARESASKLILFSAIQAFFALLYLIQDSLQILKNCGDANLPDSTIQFCAILDFTRLIVYQCWVWFAVFFNWKLGSMSEQAAENKEKTEPLSSSAERLSGRSSTFLPSSRDLF